MPRLTLAVISEVGGADVRRLEKLDASGKEYEDVADLGPCVELRKLGECKLKIDCVSHSAFYI